MIWYYRGSFFDEMKETIKKHYYVIFVFFFKNFKICKWINFDDISLDWINRWQKINDDTDHVNQLIIKVKDKKATCNKKGYSECKKCL